MQTLRLFILCLMLSWLIPASQVLAEDLWNIPKNEENGIVQRVVAADTLVLENGQKILLIGLKAPNHPRHVVLKTDPSGIPLRQDTEPTTTIEERAFEFTLTLLEGKKIRMEFDLEKNDEDNKTLAYVFLEDGTFVNTEILKQGFANLKISPPNVKYADELRKAYQEARAEKRGLQGD